MAIDVETYGAAKGYTDQSLAGGGVIKGKNCVISSIREITGGHRVTYQWTLDNGTVQQDSVDVMDGEQGPQGVKGDTGNTGATGATGPAGANGQAATIQVGTVSSGESAGVTNAGTSQNAIFNFTLPKGDKGDKGDKGADGQNGSSFSIRARFSTEEELIAAYPTGPDNPGDAYFVGTTASPDLYVWLIDDQEWHNNGPIAGVKGDKGDTGDDGFSPVAQVTKDGSVTTISVRDKTGTTTATVNDGADGQDGSDGNDGKSAYEVAVDEGFVGTESEWLASLKGDPGTNGTNGQNGTDGVSPIANVTKTGDTYKIHIEDINGTTEETIDMSSYASASAVSAIEGKIPSNASSSNKMATASDITNITDKIPSNASTSNKLVTKDDIVTRHDYSITGTTDAIADTKALVNHIITLGVGTYAGEFKRSGITFGSYRLTYLIDGIYSKSVSGIVTYSINTSTDATYQVSYVEDIEHGTPPEWKIEKLVIDDDIFKIGDRRDIIGWADLSNAESIDGSSNYANNIGRIEGHNAIIQIKNPSTSYQWPVTNSGDSNSFMDFGGSIQFFTDKVNDRLYVRYANSTDMSSWGEIATESDIAPKLQPSLQRIVITDQLQWVRYYNNNPLTYVNNTGRPIMIKVLFEQAVEGFTTMIRIDGIVVSAYANNSGRIGFQCTLSAIAPAGSTISICTDCSAENSALMFFAEAQVL